MFELLLNTLGGVVKKKFLPVVTLGTDKPGRLVGQRMATVGTTVYMLGGIDENAAFSPNLYRYNTATKTWSLGATSGVGQAGTAFVAVGKKIYALGGQSTAGPIKTFRSYDTVANTWANLTPPGTVGTDGVQFASMTNIGTDLYFLGGYYGADPVASALAYKYNTLTNVWSAIADLPAALAYATAAVVDDKIIVAHGGSGSPLVANTSIYIYDPAANTWSLGTGSPTKRLTGSAVVLDNKVYYFGGNENIEYYDLWADKYVVTAEGQTEYQYKNWVGGLCGGKVYLWGDGTNLDLTMYDLYRGEQKPIHMLIPHQELLTSTEFSTAIALTAGTLDFGAGQFMLFNKYGKVLLVPQKTIRKAAGWGVQNNAYGGGVKTIVINGTTWKVRFITGDGTKVDLENEWDYLVAPTAATYTPLAPRLSRYSNQTLGIATGGACTSLIAGAFQEAGNTRRRGRGNLNNISFTVTGIVETEAFDSQRTRPLLEYVSGPLPWLD